jgi:hypothetical protein
MRLSSLIFQEDALELAIGICRPIVHQAVVVSQIWADMVGSHRPGESECSTRQNVASWWVADDALVFLRLALYTAFAPICSVSASYILETT